MSSSSLKPAHDGTILGDPRKESNPASLQTRIVLTWKVGTRPRLAICDVHEWKGNCPPASRFPTRLLV